MRSRHSTARCCGLLIVAMGLFGGCAQLPGSDPAEDASAYASVVRWALPASRSPAPLVVYVATIGDDSIELDDQIGAIDDLSDTHDVRFIDDYLEVLDTDSPGHPPIDGSVLMGIGAIDLDGPTVTRVEVYRTEADVEAFLVTLEESVGRWRVIEYEPVQHEALVAPQ